MIRSIFLQYNRSHKLISRNLRKTMTEAETLLWSRIKNKQILDIQFNRQKPLYNYIVDFYAHQCLLVIECDGSQHYESNQHKNDVERDKTLADQGIKVLRFSNHEIFNSLEDVVQCIWHTCLQRLTWNNSSYSFDEHSDV